MHAVVIVTGISDSALSLEPRHLSERGSVGRQEIERLLGRGRSLGSGPLARFLDASTSGGVTVIVIADVANGDDAVGTVVEPLRPSAREAVVLCSPTGGIPLMELIGAVRHATAVDALGDDVSGTDVRFLVVGTETEDRVHTAATLLHRVLGFTNVAVCAHLVGSATQEAHDAALRHGLARSGVRVILDLEEAARFVGLDPETVDGLACAPCTIEPRELVESLDEDRRRIIEGLCLRWTRIDARPLQGGFSGSLLLLADGFQGEARTEPLVIKIDSFAQMRRELDGYHRVKDLFGKHVPTFGFPVERGDHIGVAMELAAMEGRPETLQDTYEAAENDTGVELFRLRFDKALDLLTSRLYGNTLRTESVVPYREFWLHTDKQQAWLRGNGDVILTYLDESGVDVGPRVDTAELAQMLRVVSRNERGIDSETCLAHGDLNLANAICDQGDNVWFIDWTHCGRAPLELDLAKLENDVKFVISKQFDFDDLQRLRMFEEYLLSHRIPGGASELPERLKFAKWDLRYRKILEAVRRIRKACFSLKKTDDWIVYRTALLRYSLHTLSFDKRRGRGEVDPPQLAHALFATETLLYDLISDDFHMHIRSERPVSYPERQQIHIDESSWLLDCESYAPPYYVAPEVLAHDRTKVDGGWADPEDVSAMDLSTIAETSRWKDDQQRPLNPRGRTGIAGRGLLGRWGPNPAVTAIVIRKPERDAEFEVLLARRDVDGDPELPAAFVRDGEDEYGALKSMLEMELAWTDGVGDAEIVFDQAAYDARQTDHAWVHAKAMLVYRE
ncbi:MAG: phosphotransferase, partial [Planctomycetota bacterium]